MAKRRLKFPQISRIFNAKPVKIGVKFLVFAVLAGFLIINLLPLPSFDLFAFEQAKITVMLFPKDISIHLILAQEYLKRGDVEALERELLLSQELVEKNPPSTPSVLGEALSPIKILEKIKNEPQRIGQEISYWENVVSQKPDYRDAYLQLAILNYRIYKNEKAKEYLKRAREIDPNYEPARGLERVLEE